MPARKEESRQQNTSERLPMRRRWSTVPHLGFASPFALMHDMSSEMDRMLQGFGLGRDRSGTAIERNNWVPQIDVFRKEGNLVVRADLPGMKKEDVTVDVDDDVLTIRGERREEKKEEDEGYYWSERRYGSFSRSIPLPDGASTEKAEARFENGVLEVKVPAPEREERRGRRIDIR